MFKLLSCMFFSLSKALQSLWLVFNKHLLSVCHAIFNLNFSSCHVQNLCYGLKVCLIMQLCADNLFPLLPIKDEQVSKCQLW